MLDKMIVRKFTIADCQEYKEVTKAELALTGLRLSRLLSTQNKNPEWAAYDKYADDIVGIDTRIEEQYAVHEELEENLRLLAEREDIIIQAAAYTGKTPNVGNRSIQLSFFDNARKRERWGVPC